MNFEQALAYLKEHKNDPTKRVRRAAWIPGLSMAFVHNQALAKYAGPFSTWYPYELYFFRNDYSSPKTFFDASDLLTNDWEIYES